MCVGLFLCCDSILLYKIENTFRNIFRRGEGIMAAELKPIDVICQPSRDGKITPMKIRVIDEDGEYQEYKIKGYNIIMRNNIGLNKKRILAARYAHWCLSPRKNILDSRERDDENIATVLQSHIFARVPTLKMG